MFLSKIFKKSNQTDGSDGAQNSNHSEDKDTSKKVNPKVSIGILIICVYCLCLVLVKGDVVLYFIKDNAVLVSVLKYIIVLTLVLLAYYLFVRHVNFEKAKDFKQWDSIIYLSVIFLIVVLLLISLSALVFNKITTVDDPNTTFAFIITSYAIFVATSVFLPKFTLKNLIADEVQEVKEQLKAEKEDFDIEIMKTEAHDNRMNAYFLLKHGEVIWALGWAIKAYKQYLYLVCHKDFDINYSDLIRDELNDGIFKEIISKIKNKDFEEDHKAKGRITRALKDYYDVKTICLDKKKIINLYLDKGVAGDTNSAIDDLIDKLKGEGLLDGIKFEDVFDRTTANNEEVTAFFQEKLGLVKKYTQPNT